MQFYVLFLFLNWDELSGIFKSIYDSKFLSNIYESYSCLELSVIFILFLDLFSTKILKFMLFDNFLFLSNVDFEKFIVDLKLLEVFAGMNLGDSIVEES